ncbi:MAG: hypothetical protein M3O32_09750 [Actinomycetota bacterium]|nr:hypothetical protein [Actinomycetota bacterium]
MGATSINAAINTGIADFNYFFGWLIPPLPPLPLAAAKTTAEVAVAATPMANSQPTMTAEATKSSEPSETAVSAPTKTTEPTRASEPPTTSTSHGVEAQGEVRGGPQATPGTTTTTTTTTGSGSTTASATATPKDKDAGNPAHADESAAVG